VEENPPAKEQNQVWLFQEIIAIENSRISFLFFGKKVSAECCRNFFVEASIMKKQEQTDRSGVLFPD
jgi:hypothetical protein